MTDIDYFRTFVEAEVGPEEPSTALISLEELAILFTSYRNAQTLNSRENWQNPEKFAMRVEDIVAAFRDALPEELAALIDWRME